ncbi:MAG TPA: quinolinate synthase NadA [Opitutaceae bacterium]|nr:quinolinate synthase NadA [Opitutaceae bacterium]
MPAVLDYEPFVLAPRREEPAPLSEIQGEILELKRRHHAVLLAHNYQIEPIQRVADYVGDSLGLSYQAAATKADVILFCGVHFMAKTAKIVNPGRLVLLPDSAAGCSLADSCPAERLAAFKAAHPDVYVVAYINCSAAVKALSDVICTSSNAVKIVRRVPPGREILFVPDQNLGQWVAKQAGRHLQLWPGSCYAHVQFTVQALEKLRRQFPDAPIVAHPECVETVRDLADEVCSTELMISFAREHPARRIIVVTESGMLHRLRRELPDKTFIAGPTDTCACNDCRFMKMNTLEKVRAALRELAPAIEIPEEIRERAFLPLQRMLEWSKG